MLTEGQDRWVMGNMDLLNDLAIVILQLDSRMNTFIMGLFGVIGNTTVRSLADELVRQLNM